ncbi:tRNA1(Val) (adenine(37)-N6)-methyltransferase [Geopsychrobacter electrodiphilus]|uniref:tRNA1(Val) (adenine(37)-N6)-methyltransferase n=1 Tax=Geopsychrobacter electrodiphilus TaxID=225196 RepID=UPI0003A57B19|nr:tRNA1(Val) (adenine(37)-N6)-methyltransferase [Geopsychrobacter electrodiphilus]
METVDILYRETIKLIQAKDGYRFSLDPVLLADFITVNGAARALDLGAGCGVLAVLLARRSIDLKVFGWERQGQMVTRAMESVRLSGLAEQVSICEADLRCFRELAIAGTFDLVVTNPPYRKINSGRIAPVDERAAARHELAGGLEDFLAAASWCLKHGGCFGIVFLAERLSELLVGMTAVGLEPKRLRMVHSRRGEPGKIVLVEGRKKGAVGLKVEPPLFIYKSSGVNEYTEEVKRIYEKE